MKIKGFWKSYWELTKNSLKWLKDYWLLYTILTIVVTVIFCLPALIEPYKWNKYLDNLRDDQDDDFLDW